jgi:hypothetical protein
MIPGPCLPSRHAHNLCLRQLSGSANYWMAPSCVRDPTRHLYRYLQPAQPPPPPQHERPSSRPSRHDTSRVCGRPAVTAVPTRLTVHPSVFGMARYFTLVSLPTSPPSVSGTERHTSPLSMGRTERHTPRSVDVLLYRRPVIGSHGTLYQVARPTDHTVHALSTASVHALLGSRCAHCVACAPLTDTCKTTCARCALQVATLVASDSSGLNFSHEPTTLLGKRSRTEQRLRDDTTAAAAGRRIEQIGVEMNMAGPMLLDATTRTAPGLTDCWLHSPCTLHRLRALCSLSRVH